VSSGWQWFDAPQHRELGDFEDDRSVATAFAKCFGSPDGKRVLEHLRRLTIERSLGPGASDALLRHLEGQRHLFAYIVALVAQGSGER
jgi:hypothetical protein